MIGDPAELLPEFDPAFYRARNADLADFSDEALAAHFVEYGEAEGRLPTDVATREGFLERVVSRQTGDILEIGPFCSPLVSGENARYLDMLDAEALRARAAEIGLDPENCPERIDYVGDVDGVDRTFAAVISSHAIEHQPDLIHHLQSVGRLLEPGGRYYLIVPDKRYCFDALIPESTIADVLQASHEKHRVHSLASVVRHRALVTHNDATRHWRGEHDPVPPDALARRIESAMADHEAADGGYIDVHAWYWTPANFRQIIDILFHLGLSPLSPARVYSTPRDRFEFCAILEKAAS